MYKFIRECKLNPNKYTECGKNLIVETNESRYVVQKKINTDIYKYLDSRSFDYYPKVLKEGDEYELVEYIEEVKTPIEQKELDMIDLVSLLHNKTTFYRKINEDNIKERYEFYNNYIKEVIEYYNGIMDIIDTRIYFSPFENMLASNITLIFESLSIAKRKLDNFYEYINKETKERCVVLHNNLKVEHFIKSDSSYLINWKNSRIDNPIFDLLSLYYNSRDFGVIIKRYEESYPLKIWERELLYAIISIPLKIKFTTEFETCREASIMFMNLSDLRNLPYYLENRAESK